MKDTIIVYGSTAGNCENLAYRIADALGVDKSKVISASQFKYDAISANDNLILGSSTWGSGDLQDEWYDAIEVLKGADLSGKTVAVFGCGDSSGFGDTFCNAIGTIYEAAKEAGANVIGNVSTDGYTFDDSTAVIDGEFVGLPLDEDNESDLSEGRISAWVDQIKPAL